MKATRHEACIKMRPLFIVFSYIKEIQKKKHGHGGSEWDGGLGFGLGRHKKGATGGACGGGGA